MRRPPKRSRSQRSTSDGPDTSETRTEKPEILTHWLDAQNMVFFFLFIDLRYWIDVKQHQLFLAQAAKTGAQVVDYSETEQESVSDTKDRMHQGQLVDDSETEPESEPGTLYVFIYFVRHRCNL